MGSAEWTAAADRLFALAALASAAGQYDRAVGYAGRAVAVRGEPTTLLSRTAFNRLTIAYKSVVDERRVGWRTLGHRLSRLDRAVDGDRAAAVVGYTRRLAGDTVNRCRDFCAIVDRHMLPGLDDPADRAHAFKLRGDFYRYTYEVSDGSLKEWSAAKACRSYQRGYDSLQGLQDQRREVELRRDRTAARFNSVRSDLAVNFAVCLEGVFGARHAAAFVRHELEDRDRFTRPREGPAAADERDYLLDYSTHLRLRLDDVVDTEAGAIDLSPGFCTSDVSDAEPEF